MVEISARAYKDAGITYVSVPETVRRIGRDAFSGNDVESVEVFDLNKWQHIVFETAGSNPFGKDTVIVQRWRGRRDSVGK